MKKALLVVSFGTRYEETRKKTIEAIEEDMKMVFPDRAFYRAWTSGRIIRSLAQTGYPVETMEEALDRMKADGMTDLLVQPTYITPGKEYEAFLEKLDAARKDFARVCVGRPLLTEEADKAAVLSALETIFADIREEEALVLMGHGTPHEANRLYADLDRAFCKRGHANWIMGTAEAVPSLADVKKRLSALGLKRVCLTPFLIVAGDHALSDMTGEEETSWLSQLEKEGYEVRTILRGLGEYRSIRQIFIDHARLAAALGQMT